MVDQHCDDLVDFLESYSREDPSSIDLQSAFVRDV